MSITSIGSSFTTTPIQPPPPAQPVEQVVVASTASDTNNQDQSSNNSGQRPSAQAASATAREGLSRSTLGVLLTTQEDTGSRPSVSPHAGAAAYSA